MGVSDSTLMQRTLACAFALCLLPVCALAANATQGTREVLLDNHEVQVVRLTYPPGSESGMHGHEYPNRVIYVVRGGTLEMVPGDSARPMQTVELTDGQVAYVPAMTHNVRNVGDSEVVLVETEIK